MFYRLIVVATLVALLASVARAQTPHPTPSASSPGWRAAGEAASKPTLTPIVDPQVRPAAAIVPTPTAVPTAAPTPVQAAAPASVARVTAGEGRLPNEHGQVWREYDISPYTLRVTATERPEQSMVDWILRETGYEAWHGEPLGVLSASKRTLRVYHTPAMQAVVAGVVDRFVASEAETFSFSLRVVSLDSPNWRTRTQAHLRPVTVQSPGVSAWLMAREEASAVLGEMQRRTDFREHSSPHLLVNNGQATVVSAKRPRSYVRDIVVRSDAWPGYETQMGQVDEGFAIDFSPLLSVDRRLIDAVIKCEVDQVEKMEPVPMDVTLPNGSHQRAKLEVPQICQYRFQERFRWPADQVLVLSLGVVALPQPVDNKPNIAGIPLPLPTAPPRADLVIFIEAKGTLPGVQAPTAAVLPARR